MSIGAGEETFHAGLATGARSLRLCYADDAMTAGRAEVLGEAPGAAAGADLARIAADGCGVAEGTMIATERGEVRVERLRPGVRVVTREAGLQPVTLIETLDLGWRQLGLLPLLRPIRIAAGGSGPVSPVRDLVLAGGLRLFPAGHGDSGVAARALIGEPGVAEAEVTAIRYVRFALPRAGAVLADGLWVEGACRADPAATAVPPGPVAASVMSPES